MGILTINVVTALYDDPIIDQAFFDYLNEYSIDHEIISEPEGPEPQEKKYPEVRYTGGPISLRNMLRERFGYTRDDIEAFYPELLQD
jgi:hypothetical protein